VVLIVKAGMTNRELVKKTVEKLQMAKANLIGVVLNQVDFKREAYYKYYSKYYGEKE
jgi:Mrp family chromosome partitioning ATPase